MAGWWKVAEFERWLDQIDQRESLGANQVTALADAVERVRVIHSPVDAVMFAGGHKRFRKVCAGCGTDDGNWQMWPCPTIRALELPAADTAPESGEGR